MSVSKSPLDSSIKRSSSKSRRPTSRPTTPLRPSSKSSFHESGKPSAGGISDSPLEIFEPAFAELSDSMADLESNFMHLQLMHESLSRFSESFASFLYGLNMNAFCVDFPEAPVADSFRRARQQEGQLGRSTNSERYHGNDFDGETTFMTTDTSFVDNPPTSSKPPKFAPSDPPSRIASASSRGGVSTAGRGGASRGGYRSSRGSGLARARGSSLK